MENTSILLSFLLYCINCREIYAYKNKSLVRKSYIFIKGIYTCDLISLRTNLYGYSIPVFQVCLKQKLITH